MTILVVSRLSAQHASVMLRAIEDLKPPCTQIIQDENALWTLLYVTFLSEPVMQDALKKLQEIAEREMAGWPLYAPPVVLAWKDTTEMFLQVMVTSSGLGDCVVFNHYETLQAFSKENLVQLQEIEEGHQGRSLLVNFVDFDTAMYCQTVQFRGFYSRRSQGVFETSGNYVMSLEAAVRKACIRTHSCWSVRN